MSALSGLSLLTPDARTDLALVIVREAKQHGALEKSMMLRFCADAITFALESADDQVEERAISSAQMLLSHTYPDMSPRTVDEIAKACGRAALSAF